MSTERVLCVLCRAGQERLAVIARDVYKVVEHARITRLPRLPAAALGITHHRGRIVTVIDTVTVLGLARSTAATSANDSRLLVLDRGTRQIGLLVDGVDEVESLKLGGDLAAGPTGALRIAMHHGVAILAVDIDRLVDLVYDMVL